MCPSKNYVGQWKCPSKTPPPTGRVKEVPPEPSCSEGAKCAVDLSNCSEDQKTVYWQGKPYLEGKIEFAYYLDKSGLLCQVKGDGWQQGWPVKEEKNWWCGSVVKCGKAEIQQTCKEERNENGCYRKICSDGYQGEWNCPTDEPMACNQGYGCVVDLSRCSEDQKDPHWKGLSYLNGKVVFGYCEIEGEGWSQKWLLMGQQDWPCGLVIKCGTDVVIPPVKNYPKECSQCRAWSDEQCVYTQCEGQDVHKLCLKEKIEPPAPPTAPPNVCPTYETPICQSRKEELVWKWENGCQVPYCVPIEKPKAYVLDYSEGSCSQASDCTYAGEGCGGGHGVCTNEPAKYVGTITTCDIVPKHPINNNYSCSCIESEKKCGWIKEAPIETPKPVLGPVPKPTKPTVECGIIERKGDCYRMSCTDGTITDWECQQLSNCKRETRADGCSREVCPNKGYIGSWTCPIIAPVRQVPTTG